MPEKGRRAGNGRTRGRGNAIPIFVLPPIYDHEHRAHDGISRARSHATKRTRGLGPVASPRLRYLIAHASPGHGPRSRPRGSVAGRCWHPSCLSGRAAASTVTANRSGASRRAPGWSHARSQGARDPGTGRIWKLRAYTCPRSRCEPPPAAHALSPRWHQIDEGIPPHCRSAPLHLPPMRCVSARAACQRP